MQVDSSMLFTAVRLKTLTQIKFCLQTVFKNKNLAAEFFLPDLQLFKGIFLCRKLNCCLQASFIGILSCSHLRPQYCTQAFLRSQFCLQAFSKPKISHLHDFPYQNNTILPIFPRRIIAILCNFPRRIWVCYNGLKFLWTSGPAQSIKQTNNTQTDNCLGYAKTRYAAPFHNSSCAWAVYCSIYVAQVAGLLKKAYHCHTRAQARFSCDPKFQVIRN